MGRRLAALGWSGTRGRPGHKRPERPSPAIPGPAPGGLARPPAHWCSRPPGPPGTPRAWPGAPSRAPIPAPTALTCRGRALPALPPLRDRAGRGAAPPRTRPQLLSSPLGAELRRFGSAPPPLAPASQHRGLESRTERLCGREATPPNGLQARSPPFLRLTPSEISPGSEAATLMGRTARPRVGTGGISPPRGKGQSMYRLRPPGLPARSQGLGVLGVRDAGLPGGLRGGAAVWPWASVRALWSLFPRVKWKSGGRVFWP